MSDLISRAAAIKYLMTNMGWHDDDGYEVEDADEKRKVITDLVNGIPAVDSAPVKHAEWVESSDEGHQPRTHYKCSACGVVWGVSTKAMKYCPGCGAKMINCPLWDMDDERRRDNA